MRAARHVKILVMVLGISWKLGFIIHQEYHKIKGKKDKIMEVLVLVLGSLLYWGVFRKFGIGIGIFKDFSKYWYWYWVLLRAFQSIGIGIGYC